MPGTNGAVDAAGAARSAGRPRRSRRRARTTPRSCQALAVAVQQLHRHRVEHLVADDHAAIALGPGVQPLAPCRRMRASALALALAQRARQVDDACSARRASPSASSSCAASAPEPAPNSHTSSVPVRSQRLRHLPASARPNSGVSSGAVTKSLPDAGIAPNLRLPLA